MENKRKTNVVRTKEEVLTWYKEYLETDITTKELDNKYKTDSCYQFKKYSLDTSKKLNKRPKNRIELKYLFETISNEKEAYIMGFFLADGSVSKNKTLIKFHQKDYNILNSIRQYIAPQASITKDKKIFVLNICSYKIGENLKNIFDLDHNKTYEDFLLPIMKESLYRHFIRGYFDADGTVYYDKKYLRWNICSITQSILIDIKKVLNKKEIFPTINCEIRENKEYLFPQNTEKKGNCRNMYRLKIGKRLELLKMYEYLYKDATIFLERKHNIFKQYANIELTFKN